MGKESGYVAVQMWYSNWWEEDMIDCYYITVLPTLLGSGIACSERAGKREN